MHFQTTLVAAALATLASAQTLNIPTRVGSIISLAKPSTISGSVDLGNKEYDRGVACDTDADTGSDSAVFILNDGATLSNVIIGVKQLEGVHCKGACTLKNVWFRDVCEGKNPSSEVTNDHKFLWHLQLPCEDSGSGSSFSHRILCQRKLLIHTHRCHLCPRQWQRLDPRRRSTKCKGQGRSTQRKGNCHHQGLHRRQRRQTLPLMW